MTEYRLGRFTARYAEALIGTDADITEWDGDEGERKITYPGATIIGIIEKHPCLYIRTRGAVVTDAETGEVLTVQAAQAEWHVSFFGICEISNICQSRQHR